MATTLTELGHREPKVYTFTSHDSNAIRSAAEWLRHERPEAIVCYDDKMALQIMDAIRELGSAIPEDVGIVGFDDIPFARIANPRLTTVAQPSETMGRISAYMLFEVLTNGQLPLSGVIPVELQVRESTRRIGTVPTQRNQ